MDLRGWSESGAGADGYEQSTDHCSADGCLPMVVRIMRATFEAFCPVVFDDRCRHTG